MSLADQPAFPRNRVYNDGSISYEQDGMTYRQWLVGMALQGLCAFSASPIGNYDKTGELALQYADAAIRAQEKS